MLGTGVKPSFMMFSQLGGEILRQREVIKPTYSFQINIIKIDFSKVIEIFEKGNKVEEK
jgi:hypothetical protein